MRRRRLIVPSEVLTAPVGQAFILSAELSQHLRVLRLEAKAPLELRDGEGRVAAADVLSWQGKRAVVACARVELEDTRVPPAIVLLAAVGKGEKLDAVVRQASELGVAAVVPVVSERSVATRENRRERLQSIADDGLRISGRSHRARVQPVHSWKQALGVGADLRLVLALGPKSQPLREKLPRDRPESLALLVGPEGGFSDPELEEAEASGFERAHLGPHTLRTETAGPAVVAMVRYQYGLG